MKIRRLGGAVALIVLGGLAGFCALEGVSSLIGLIGNLLTFRAPSFKEQLYTRYDRFTRWPAGFRPEEHGARLVEWRAAEGGVEQ